MERYFDGRMQPLPAPDALMSLRALAFGDGFFSTMGVHQGRLLFADGHRLRFERSAAAFAIAIDIDRLMQQLQADAHRVGEGIIKVIVSRDVQPLRGYGFSPADAGAAAMIFIQYQPSPIYQSVSFIDGIPVQLPMTAMTLQARISPRLERLAGVKLIACTDQIFAHAELLAHQAADGDIKDGLLSDSADAWACATMGNIFYRQNDQWYTPPVGDGVAGVMREWLLANAKVKIAERTLGKDELMRIEALVITNAVRGITPVARLYIKQDADKKARKLAGDLPI